MGKVVGKRCFALACAGAFVLTMAAALVTAQTANAQERRVQADMAAGSPQGATELGTQKSKYTTVAKVRLNKKRATVKNDGTVRLVAKLVPKEAGKRIKNKKVKWHLSNKKIASVSQDGVVRGKKSGTVRVVATSANGKRALAIVKVVVDKSKMATRIPVLTYHRITTDSAKRRFYSGTNLAVSASLFKRQMKWLSDNGYRTISTAEFRDWRVNGTFLPKKSVLITIDDGFYETYYVAYPILKRFNLKATSFVIGTYTDDFTYKYNPDSSADHYVGTDVIAKLAEEYPNLEFQSHTYNMHHRGSGGSGVLRSWSRSQVLSDFKKNDKFGFTAIAWPYGHWSYNGVAGIRASKTLNIAFGYMMDHPATRKSWIYNIPRFKVFGDRGLEDFKRIVRTAG